MHRTLPGSMLLMLFHLKELGDTMKLETLFGGFFVAVLLSGVILSLYMLVIISVKHYGADVLWGAAIFLFIWTACSYCLKENIP